jgi:DNA-binding XRE family transcriptional regulator
MPMLTIYRNQLDYSRPKLAMEARVSYRTIVNAENGEPITVRSAVLIAQALSRGLEKMIVAQHVEGLNIR